MSIRNVVVVVSGGTVAASALFALGYATATVVRKARQENIGIWAAVKQTYNGTVSDVKTKVKEQVA